MEVKAQSSKVKGQKVWWFRHLAFDFRLSTSAVRQRGDTIVEVLLAMTVIGAVLGASFGIANRSAQTGQAARERTEALKIAESQIELLKTYHEIPASGVSARTTPFCIDEGQVPGSGEIADPASATCSNIDGSGGTGLYTVVIFPGSSPTDTYQVEVVWERINTDAPSKTSVSLFYRVGAL